MKNLLEIHLNGKKTLDEDDDDNDENFVVPVNEGYESHLELKLCKPNGLNQYTANKAQHVISRSHS